MHGLGLISTDSPIFPGAVRSAPRQWGSRSDQLLSSLSGWQSSWQVGFEAVGEVVGEQVTPQHDRAQVRKKVDPQN